MDYLAYKNTFLAHHGILGQKWGVRRFQNLDGSLTPEGRERYNVGDQSAPMLKELANTPESKKGLTDPKYFISLCDENDSVLADAGIDVLGTYGIVNKFLADNKNAKKLETGEIVNKIATEIAETRPFKNPIFNVIGPKFPKSDEQALIEYFVDRIKSNNTEALTNEDLWDIAERASNLATERDYEEMKNKLRTVQNARNRLGSSYTGTAGSKEHLAHHGIKGQKWGVRNGPPYPLKAGAHSSAEERYLKGGKKAVGVAKSKAERKRLTEANSDNSDKAASYEKIGKVLADSYLKGSTYSKEQRTNAREAVANGDPDKALSILTKKSGRAGLAPLSDTSKAEKDHILETGSMKDLKRFVKQHPGTVSANEYQQFFNRINLENSLKSKVAEERVDTVNRVSSMVGAVGDLADKGAKLYNVIAAIHNARAASAADRWKLLDTKNIQVVNNTISIAKENARKTLVKDASKEKTEGDKGTQKNEKALEKVQEADQKAGVKAAKKSAKQAEKELRSAQNQKVKDIYENARVQNEAYKVAKENSRKAIQRLASKSEVTKDVEEIEKSVVSRMKKEVSDRDSKGIFKKKKKK